MAPAKKAQSTFPENLGRAGAGRPRGPKALSKHTINVHSDAFNDFRLIQQRVSSFLGFRLSANQTLQHIMAKYPNQKLS